MDEKKRACGPRQSKKTPDAYVKDELVYLVVKKYGMKKTEAKRLTKRALCDIINREEEESDDDEKKTRPCGPRKSKKNPDAYTKREIVERAVDGGMKKSVAKNMKVKDLCVEVFGEIVDVVSEEEEEEFDYRSCTSYTLSQLKKFSQFMGLSDTGGKKKLCESLVSYEINKMQNVCLDMDIEDIKTFAKESGISTVGTKKDICLRIMNSEREKAGLEPEEENDYVSFLKKYFDSNSKQREKLLDKYQDILPIKFLKLFTKMSNDEQNEFIDKFLEPQNIEKNMSDFIVEFISKEQKDDKELYCIRKSKLPLKDYQKVVVKHMLNNRGLITIFGTGRGKCHGKDTPIMMSDGSIKMVQDIKQGDLLMGDDSTPRKVLSLTGGIENLYKIEQKNGGDDYIVNESHILSLKNTSETSIHKNKINGIDYIIGKWFDNKTIKYKSKSFRYTPETENDVRKQCRCYLDKLKIETKVDIPLVDYLKFSNTRKKELKGYRVSVDFHDKSVEFDPYFLGLWLGDVSSNEPAITNTDKEIVDYLYKEFPDYDFRISKDITYHMTPKENKGRVGSNKMRNFLKRYNLMGNKHIPDDYKLNSREKRLRLLAGLIDTDGYYNPSCHVYEIIQKSEKLSFDIQYLCRTLGLRCKKVKVNKTCHNNGVTGEYYRINISGSSISEIPVLLERKKAQSNPNKDQLCNEIKVVPMGLGEYWGFEIDGNHRYLLGDCTVTHNSLTAVTCIQCVLSQNPKMKIVIITPTSLVENMKKEFRAYGADPDDDRITFTTVTKFSNDFENGNIKCINTFLIVDEAQNLKSHTGKNAKSVIKCAKKASKVLLLTATPVMNRPNEIVNLIGMVDGEDPITPENFDNYIMTDDKAFDDFFRCKISYVKGGNNEDYPEFEEHMVEFEMDKKYYSRYRDVEKGQETALCRSLFGCGNNLQAFYNGIRRAANNIESENGPKINWIINKILDENKKNKKNKTLIYSSFIEAGSKLVMKRLDKLKIPYVKVDGSMSKTKRKQSVDEYNSGEVCILFISKAGGEGLDLKGTRHVIITEPAWNDANLEQVKGRAIRYKSHEALPVKDRRVDVWNLYMTKPEERDEDDIDGMESIDIVMRDQSLAKTTEINEFMDRLIPLSIENSDCGVSMISD